MKDTQLRLSSLERQARIYRRVSLLLLLLLSVGLAAAAVQGKQKKVIECDLLKARELVIVTKKGAIIARISTVHEDTVMLTLGRPEKRAPGIQLKVSELEGTPMALIKMYSPGPKQGAIGTASMACSSGVPHVVVHRFGGGQTERAVIVGGSVKHPSAAIELRHGASRKQWPK